jgi:hypothetical protein
MRKKANYTSKPQNTTLRKPDRNISPPTTPQHLFGITPLIFSKQLRHGAQGLKSLIPLGLAPNSLQKICIIPLTE